MEAFGSIEYIPKLWSDIVIFDQNLRERLIDAVLNIMVNNPAKEDSELVQKFFNIAWDIYTAISEQRLEKINRLK